MGVLGLICETKKTALSMTLNELVWETILIRFLIIGFLVFIKHFVAKFNYNIPYRTLYFLNYLEIQLAMNLVRAAINFSSLKLQDLMTYIIQNNQIRQVPSFRKNLFDNLDKFLTRLNLSCPILAKLIKNRYTEVWGLIWLYSKF